MSRFKVVVSTVSLVVLLVLGFVVGCSDMTTANKTGNSESAVNKMSFSQHVRTEYSKRVDNERFLKFTMQLAQGISMTRSTDVESLIQLYVDNLHILVDDDLLHEVILLACQLYGIDPQNITFYTTQEIIQQFLDMRGEFGGDNLLSSDIGQTISNFINRFVDESSFTDSDKNNLDNLFSIITNGAFSIDDLKDALAISATNGNLSANYLEFIDSAISTFSFYKTSNVPIDSYIDKLSAAMELIGCSDMDDGDTILFGCSTTITVGGHYNSDGDWSVSVQMGFSY